MKKVFLCPIDLYPPILARTIVERQLVRPLSERTEVVEFLAGFLRNTTVGFDDANNAVLELNTMDAAHRDSCEVGFGLCTWHQSGIDHPQIRIIRVVGSFAEVLHSHSRDVSILVEEPDHTPVLPEA